ncbi:DUF4843 domain-containing protein [Sphingobacterium sp. N143]|uniref:DUF4843 domain-containing protein n=1 Tax=Sphingobacterium sp. N143 TaxID=2746727 RepID=UPI0025767D2C|nr:DUF4843 domain-containing protein [Sphingobacterium sp. N143]MDM1295390.1 DUF4843 domain-containing protein [Sphingobacterium sp. N143]
MSLFISCKKTDLATYTGENNIYFNNKLSNQTYIPVDYGIYSFGYVDPKIRETVFPVIVMTTGGTSEKDRPYKLVIDPASTLVKGRDYTIENKSFTIKAGQVSDTLQVKLLRSTELKKESLGLLFKLEPNENFSTSMNSQEIGTGNNKYTSYFTQFTLEANDIPGAPDFWDPAKSNYASLTIAYLGQFSGTKFKLLIERFGLNLEELTSPSYIPSASGILAWTFGLKSYLDEQAATGNPILDDNGKPMELGVYAQ